MEGEKAEVGERPNVEAKKPTRRITIYRIPSLSINALFVILRATRPSSTDRGIALTLDCAITPHRAVPELRTNSTLTRVGA